jgi:hypothetical protein
MTFQRSNARDAPLVWPCFASGVIDSASISLEVGIGGRQCLSIQGRGASSRRKDEA